MEGALELVTVFFVAAFGVVIVLVVMGVSFGRRAFEARRERLAQRKDPTAAALDVFLDVRSRVLKQFLAAGFKGTQLRHAIHQGTVRVTYQAKKLPNGVEHKLLLSPEGALPQDAGKKALMAELAPLAVFLAGFTGLEPVMPLDVDLAQASVGLTRVLTDEQSRALEMKRVPRPGAEEIAVRWAKAQEQAGEVKRDIAAA